MEFKDLNLTLIRYGAASHNLHTGNASASQGKLQPIDKKWKCWKMLISTLKRSFRPNFGDKETFLLFLIGQMTIMPSG